MVKIFICEKESEAERLRPVLGNEWEVCTVGGVLAGKRFDHAVITTICSDSKYLADHYASYFDLVKCKLPPGEAPIILS